VHDRTQRQSAYGVINRGSFGPLAATGYGRQRRNILILKDISGRDD
jgi:hypothetical protein